MNIIKSVLIIMLLFSSGYKYCISQESNNIKRERIESQKVAFITDKLDLSPREAQDFWPLYNEYQDKKRELSGKTRETLKNAMLNIDKLSEDEMESLLNDYVTLQKKEASLNEEYMNRLKKVISPRKVMKLYITEIQFKNYLLKQIRENRVKQRAGRRF